MTWAPKLHFWFKNWRFFANLNLETEKLIYKWVYLGSMFQSKVDVHSISKLGCDPMGTMFSTYWYLTQSKKFCSCRFNNFAKYLLSNTLQKLLNSFKFCQTGAISQNLVTLIILIIVQKLGHVENRNKEVKDENLFKKRFGKTGFDGSCKNEISRKKGKKEKSFFRRRKKERTKKFQFHFNCVERKFDLKQLEKQSLEDETGDCRLPAIPRDWRNITRKKERESKSENS